MSALGVNKVVLRGRSGGDAELKFTSGGKPVANFSLAVNESFKTRDGEKADRVEWFRCVCWNKLGEIAGQYVTRGKLLSQAFDKCLYRQQEFIESKRGGRPDGWSTAQFSFT